MRRIKNLINDVRFQANESGSNRFTDFKFNKLFTDAQEEIQRIVYTSNTNAKFFVEEVTVDLVGGQESYDLPSNIYAGNAVNSMARRTTVDSFGGDYYTPLRQLTEKERRTEIGYIIQGSKFLVSPIPTINLTNGLRINYTRKLPTLSSRVGQIKSVAGNEISLEIGYSTEDITAYSDYICIINKDGSFDKDVNDNNIDVGLEVASYNPASGKITLDASTPISSTTLRVGDYVVVGQLATDVSELPDTVEQYLTTFVERKIFYINSSKDIQNSQVFKEEERQALINLFTLNEQDTKYPPIIDNNYLNF